MPGNTPDRGIFRRRVGKNDFFSKKAGKTLIVFKKDLNIKSGKITHMQHLLWTTWIIKERSEQEKESGASAAGQKSIQTTRCRLGH